MARFIYINPTGYPIEQLPREWHGISPFTEAQAVGWRKVWLPDVNCRYSSLTFFNRTLTPQEIKGLYVEYKQ